jgi:hypothetical protein
MTSPVAVRRSSVDNAIPNRRRALTLLEQNVLRLDVAMDDATVVCAY